MFIVIEIQKATADATPALLTNVYNDEETALQQYFTILAAAAVSNLALHSAVLMTPDGNVLRCESFGR